MKNGNVPFPSYPIWSLEDPLLNPVIRSGEEL